MGGTTIPRLGSLGQQLQEADRLQAETFAALAASTPWVIAIVENGAVGLATMLAAVEARGAEVRYVLTNGVDRWTIVARMPDADQGEG